MRLLSVFILALLPLALQLSAAPIAAQRVPAPDTPLLTGMPVNGSMECPSRVSQAGINGAVPGGWTGVVLFSVLPPNIESAHYYFGGNGCGPTGAFIEHLEGQDAWVFLSGPQFDAALYQQIAVQPGVSYSLSGWMASPTSPSAPYPVREMGIDPSGGTDPWASSIVWASNSDGQSGWKDLRIGATAQGTTLTVFARVITRSYWEENRTFLDAVKLVQAPTAAFVNLPAQVYGHNFPVTWTGDLGPDIPLVPNGDYHLYFDLEYRIGGSAANWQPWLAGQAAGSATFGVCNAGVNPVISFRVRPRAEQPCTDNRICTFAWPNHRFPGVWTESPPVQMIADTSCSQVRFLPFVAR